MGSRWLVVVILGLASPAFADDEADDDAPPKPELGRGVIGFGASGMPELHDHAPTFDLGLRWNWPRGKNLSFGTHVVLGARAWGAIPRFYASLDDCDAKTGDCVLQKLLGYPFGWLAAFASFDVGWDLRVRGEGRSAGWLSFGTSIYAVTDYGSIGSDAKTEYVIGHGGNLGIGYDFGSAGLALRATVVRDFAIFIAGGTADVAYNVQGTIEIPFDE